MRIRFGVEESDHRLAGVGRKNKSHRLPAHLVRRLASGVEFECVTPLVNVRIQRLDDLERFGIPGHIESQLIGLSFHCGNGLADASIQVETVLSVGSCPSLRAHPVNRQPAAIDVFNVSLDVPQFGVVGLRFEVRSVNNLPAE